MPTEWIEGDGWDLKDLTLIRHPYPTFRHYQGVAITEWSRQSDNRTIYQIHLVNLTTADTFTDKEEATQAAKTLYNSDNYTGYPPYQPTQNRPQLRL